MADVTPVFLLSLPRSGSTLLQRIISTHADVATASEPWVLLPPLGVFDPQMSRSLYGHQLLSIAVNDFTHSLGAGVDDYYASVRAFANTLYSAASHGRGYFLDKTPRYHLIARRLVDCFPEAKFILMWRNPLAVAGSLIHSYADVWRPHRMHVDLYTGLRELLSVARARSGALLVVRYEDVVGNPEASVASIFEHIGLPIPEAAIQQFSRTKLVGKLGDRTGIASYNQLSAEPLRKWQTTLASPVRRRWALSYLDWIGPDDLAFMGYDYSELRSQLNGLRSRWRGVPRDFARLAYSRVYLKLTGGLV